MSIFFPSRKLKRRVFPNSFDETNFILITKPDKNIIRKGTYMDIPHEYICKKFSTTYVKMLVHFTKWVYPQNAGLI